MTTPNCLDDMIVRTAGFIGGRPRIANHRIGVEDIAALAGQGYEALDIVASIFTELTLAEVHAALAYYYANRDEIDGYMAEHRRLMEAHLASKGHANGARGR